MALFLKQIFFLALVDDTLTPEIHVRHSGAISWLTVPKKERAWPLESQHMPDKPEFNPHIPVRFPDYVPQVSWSQSILHSVVVTSLSTHKDSGLSLTGFHWPPPHSPPPLLSPLPKPQLQIWVWHAQLPCRSMWKVPSCLIHRAQHGWPLWHKVTLTCKHHHWHTHQCSITRWSSIILGSKAQRAEHSSRKHWTFLKGLKTANRADSCTEMADCALLKEQDPPE